MTDADKTVFISYRRDVSAFIARAVFMDLRLNGFDAFIDVESIDSGAFDTVILNQIAARAHFVLILTPGSVERCNEPGDWLRREIETAIDLGRNIVPLLVNNFAFKEVESHLSGKLVGLPRYNALDVPHAYFDEAMTRLRTRFLKQPVGGSIQPTPKADAAVVQQKIDEAANQPAPTRDELSAEQLLARSLSRSVNGDSTGAIADLDEALRIKPDYATAYALRGTARIDTGELDGALADFDRAIALEPEHHLYLYNRAVARGRKGDPTGAIDDYSASIRLNPRHAVAYNNRALEYLELGFYKEALEDCDKALEMEREASFYDSRAQVYFALDNYAKALEDFKEANHLLPGSDFVLAGLAITRYGRGQVTEAARIWKVLLRLDSRFSDTVWVQRQLDWPPPLMIVAQKLIAEL